MGLAAFNRMRRLKAAQETKKKDDVLVASDYSKEEITAMNAKEQKAFVEKHNIDIENLKSVYDFEPVLKTLYENEKDIFTISPVSFTGITLNEKYQRFGNASFVAVEQLSDGSLKAYSTHELPEYLKELELYREWYKKGYIRKDIIRKLRRLLNHTELSTSHTINVTGTAHKNTSQ